VTGRLKVSSSNALGDEIVLSILGPGDVFGEIALLDGKARSATVSALEDCELLVIGREVFRDLLVELPPLTLSLMTIMARRLRHLTEHTQDVSLLDVERRLAKAILSLAARFGEDHGHGRITLEPRLSQQELANMVGASRELVNRRLRTWVDDGIISMTAGELVIENAGALANVAGPA
jgi:CRP-like cAMP-binding protein